MCAIFMSSPSFRSDASFAPLPTQRKTQGDIIKERQKEEVKEALKKTNDERDLGDYCVIAMGKINDLIENAPVIYASENKGLDYKA